MKCGIMTFFGIPNYGAVLQAYSLCKVIREMGISCELINYVCNNIVKRKLTPRKTSNDMTSMTSAACHNRLTMNATIRSTFPCTFVLV